MHIDLVILHVTDSEVFIVARCVVEVQRASIVGQYNELVGPAWPATR